MRRLILFIIICTGILSPVLIGGMNSEYSSDVSGYPLGETNVTLESELKTAEEILFNLSDFELSQGVINRFNESLNHAKKEFDEGNLTGANEILIRDFWNPLAELLENMTKDFSQRFNRLANESKMCIDIKLNESFRQVMNLITESKERHSNFKEVIKILKEIKERLKHMDDCVMVEKRIKNANTSFESIKEYREILEVDNITLMRLEDMLKNASILLEEGNISKANETVNILVSKIEKIVENRHKKLDKICAACLEHCEKEVGRNLTFCKELLEKVSRNLKSENINDAVKYLCSAEEFFEKLEKSCAECLIKKAEEMVSEYNRLPSECYNLSDINLILKKAEDFFKNGRYGEAIDYATKVIEHSSEIKNEVIKWMEEKLGESNISVSNISVIEDWGKRLSETSLKLRKEKEKKPIIPIIVPVFNPDEDLKNADNALKKANNTILALRMYLEARETNNTEEFINATIKFDNLIKRGVEEPSKLFEDAEKYIKNANRKRLINTILSGILMVVLIGGLAYASYVGYVNYQIKKRAGEAKKIVKYMGDLLRDLEQRLKKLELYGDEGVIKDVNVLRRLLYNAENALKNGEYREVFYIKEEFSLIFERLHRELKSYEKTLNMSISGHVAAKSYIGRRQNNEDSYIVEKVGGNILLAVADGMGGHLAGEIASKKAIEVLRETLERNKFGDPKDIFRKAIERANEVIYKMGHDPAHPEWYNMGTTLTAAIIRGDEATIANIGDSRTYLIKPDGSIEQLTRDHSLVQELIDRGEITPEEARRHPQKNIITKALGIAPDIKIDPDDIKTIQLKEGDYLLLCSDGLSDVLSDKEIAKTVVLAPSLKEAVNNLVDKAYSYGSDDNITVVLYRHS